MNIGLGFLVEVVAFVAAAYVVVALRPRLPRQTTDIVLGAVGCAIGAGALLFQQDVSLAGGVLAPLVRGRPARGARARVGCGRRDASRVGEHPPARPQAGVR